MLTVKQIEAAIYGKGPDRLADVNGLYLRLNKGGSKTFQVRVTAEGRTRWKTIGKYPQTTLKDARLEAVLIKSNMSGRDAEPVGVQDDPPGRRESLPDDLGDGSSLREVAKIWYDRKKAGLSNGKHALQNWTTVNQYILQHLGDLRPADIKRRDIIRVLDPIWRTKHETARRTLGRLREIFELAILQELLEVNPAIFDPKMAFGPVQRHTKHMAALHWERAPDFWSWLANHDCDEGVRQMIMAIILTGKRTMEARTAVWSDIDLPGGIWTTTQERMKKRRPHRVPMSAQLSVVFHNLLLLNGPDGNDHGLVLPRPKNKSGMIDENRARLEIQKFDPAITGHGMRSTFRTWARKQGTYSRDLMEYALAHEKDKVVDAYLRDDLLEERRPMMQAWADFVTGSRMPHDLRDDLR
ncbi:tyrosine-type recombinase/integrase [Jannaschia pohangensis]|uniref:Integrase n=1 Tax=Jannaschia pohangensis TaxID=390807 RepID=A0A1I3MYK3_9RHOB|nr:integrase arm-type DNA-binding domain-containing protein [Jannaschia pohangensis]SFJ02059.1 Integrase [Jannaschia pohangensis]